MAYATKEAREDLLGTIAVAIEELGLALADLGAAYEQLDERSADRLEEQLFRPVQVAYGRAKRTHGAFAERHALQARSFDAASPRAASRGVAGLLEDAVDAVARADAELTELQDSMMPVEVGDPELRAGLADVRALIGDVRSGAREFMRTFGR